MDSNLSVVSLAPSYSVGVLTNHASCMQPSLDIFNENVDIATCPFDSIIYSVWRVPQCRHPTLGRCLTLRDASLGRWAMIHLGGDTSRREPIIYTEERRFYIRRLRWLCWLYGDYIDFLTTYLSLVHVITPDDLDGTKKNRIIIIIIIIYILNYYI